VRPLLTQFLRPYRRQLVVVLVLLLLQAMGNLYLPSLNADIINNGVLTGDLGYIVRVGAVMLVVTLLVGTFAVVGVYFSAQSAMAMGRDVRRALFGTVETFSLRELNQFGAPSLITRNTNDVQQVQMLVLTGLTMMVSAPLMAVGGIIMAVRENAKLSALLLVVIPLMGLVVWFMVTKAVPLFQVMQRKIDRINAILRENLAGIRVIRAFVRTEHEEQRFAVANEDLTETALRVTRIFAVAMPSLMLIMNLSTVAVVWFGGHLVDSGQMPIGNLTAFLSYIMLILTSVLMAVMMLIMVPRAAVSADRIQEVLQTEPALVDPRAPSPATAPALGVVELVDVEFRYAGAEASVLRGVSFVARPGKVTAVVGSTGSGKSTLVNLIPRLQDVTGGTLALDGRDVRDMPQSELRSHLGFVPQRSMLFSGTIASNLRFGQPDATDEQLWHALDVAQAKGFVSELAEGLEAPVDQGGANLSGGQRQRLAIARALVRQPLVYVFDDSFSALDYVTDSRLRSALRAQTHRATVIIVAQRVSTIMHADQIVVLDAGTVAGIGTHAALIEECETYREIVYSQLTADEVA
jgi:ATP-binding cassette subfamily B multidrug efflux pump